MMEEKSILVVAFKYNDILYSLGTSEFQEAEYKKLVIFFVEGRNPEDFPFQDAFDEVEYVKYNDDVKNLWRNIMRIRKMKWSCDVLTFSNPILLATKYISKLSKAKKILWLEDGLMNYYPLSDIPFNSSRAFKKTIQFILGLNDKKLFGRKELVTYLLCPEMAVSYWGTVRKLSFSQTFVNNTLLKKLSFIQGKKLFIGQALYNTDGISKDYYVDTVNKVIAKEGIDYYVPHYGSKDEKIKCEFLNLQDYHITFEFLACAYSFILYSVSSTLLYSTRKINPDVSTYMVKLEGVDNNKLILQKTVNGIIVC